MRNISVSFFHRLSEKPFKLIIMSINRIRKIIKLQGFVQVEEYIENTPERDKSIEKIKKLYNSVGRNNSTLSKDGEDSDRIKS